MRIRRRSPNWIWASFAAIVAIALLVALDLLDDPASSWRDVLLNLGEELPLVLVTVSVVLLYQFVRRQLAENRGILHELEAARSQGQHWRDQAQVHLSGLGVAIDAQFSEWGLSEAEREVALLLLKGLSSKEIATVRATSERTVREQARAVYAKGGLTGRSALAAYFLEDLLAPSGPPASESAKARRSPAAQDNSPELTRRTPADPTLPRPPPFPSRQ